MTTDKFRFRKHASIGAYAAEDDEDFLYECFIDTGDLSTLIDCHNPRRIILGRTGTGKTALLNALAKKQDAIFINPEDLSFNYLSKSTVLKFFLEAGVKLDLFFRLLWRHVFTIELLKKKYDIKNEVAKKTFLDQIKFKITRNKKKERALDYLLKWDDRFWEETEFRIKEITTTIENELRSSLGTDLKKLIFNLSGGTKLGEKERAEIVHRGQSVINSIHMKELTDILDFLNEDIFDDEKQNFYICIDKLDEHWVDDQFRYLLIRSLVETLRDFRRVTNVKIIIVLRYDLLGRVFRLTRDPGFQEEKYRSLYLQIKWTESQLKELLNKRVNYLVRQTYTKKPVGYKDLLPKQIGTAPTINYMLERTLMRPRELIELFNTCIEQAEGNPTINKKSLLAAEGIYSKNRLRSLQDEWFADYPKLSEMAFIIKKKPKHFRIKELDREKVEEFCLNYVIDNYYNDDELSIYVKNVAEGKIDVNNFYPFLFNALYRTGIVGLKTETFQGYQWVKEGPSSVPIETIDASTRVAIHPMFWRELGIKP